MKREIASWKKICSLRFVRANMCVYGCVCFTVEANNYEVKLKSSEDFFRSIIIHLMPIRAVLDSYLLLKQHTTREQCPQTCTTFWGTSKLIVTRGKNAVFYHFLKVFISNILPLYPV